MKNNRFKRIAALVSAIVLLFSSMAFPKGYSVFTMNASAASVTLNDLKSKFPDGYYWNHYVSTSSEAYDSIKANGISTSFDNSVSTTPCANHGGSYSYSWYVGKYDCNRFNGGSQCCGFAQKLASVAYGSSCTAWSTRSSVGTLKAGDVIHYYGAGADNQWGHWVMVISASGSSITVGECNYGGRCKISWGRSMNLSNVSSMTVYIAPWTLPTSGSTPTTLVTDTRYPTPFKCRIISTTKVQCYNDADKSSSPGYIYPEDDCVVNAIYTNGMLKCDCPWSDGTTKTVYIDKTAFINSSSAPSNMTAPQKADTYLRTDKATNIGWIDPGDSITKVATSGSMTQIIYPASVGKRCAWVDTSALAQISTSWKVPFNCYIIPTEKTRCYNDAALSDSPGYIYVDDDCIINAVTSNGVVQCLCPWSDGTTKTVYVDSSVFFASASTPVQMTAPKYAVTYLRTSDTSASWGWIDPGDTIYKVGTSGNMTQIIYPGNTSTGWRCAWVYSSELTESYTVSYNANGGTGAPAAQTKVYNVNLALSSTIPTRNGYTFLGWATSQTATTAAYAAGGSYTANAAATLYAVWKANQYNISFDLNGGTGTIAPQTKTHGVELTLTSVIPTRVGHQFLGWSSDKNAVSAAYTAGSKYSQEGSIILYAIWQADQYTITFDSNGGVGGPTSQTKTYGNNLILSSDVPQKEGYTFIGWAVEATPDLVEYEPGDTYYYDCDVTLYAIWEENAPEYTPGDINGDDSVNNKDLTRLMKFLAGEEVEVVELALDVNGDGTVNNKDLTRLMKYLAGEDVEIH